MTGVTIRAFKGRFDLCQPSKEEWQLRVQTPFGSVSELFDDEPDAPGVEDALGLIEARQKDFWIKTNRDEKLAAVQAIREHLTECEALFYEGEIAALERRRDDITSEIYKKTQTLAWLRKEIESARNPQSA